MKKLLTISGILSWINLIIGGLLVLAMLLSVLMSPSKLMAMISLMMVIAIVLHSYAALQLRKSFLHPDLPLSEHTPTGIRFIGFVAMLFAVTNLSQAVTLLANPQLIMDTLQEQMPKELQSFDLKGMIRAVGIIILVFGLSILSNVLLNLYLLKAYQQKDVSE